MRRHLLFQLLLTGLFVIVISDPAGAQRRAFGGGLLGAGIGGAAGGKKGAAIDGAQEAGYRVLIVIRHGFVSAEPNAGPSVFWSFSRAEIE